MSARTFCRLDRLRSYMARVGVAALCLFVLFAVWRFAGESQRQDVRVSRTSARLEAAITADCSFVRRIADLPAESIRRHQPLTPVLVELAASARAAYLGKHCAEALDPATGRPNGPPPPVYKLPAAG